MITETLKLFIIFLLILCFWKTENRIERLFLSPNYKRYKRKIDSTSKKLFKLFLTIVAALSSIEIVFFKFNQFEQYKLNIFIILFLLLGIFLRISAILTLGDLWSFDVDLKENHYLIKEGPYKFLKHPAYLGNIYIVCFLILIKATVVSVPATIFLIFFYLYRSRMEEIVLSTLNSEQNIPRVLRLQDFSIINKMFKNHFINK